MNPMHTVVALTSALVLAGCAGMTSHPAGDGLVRVKSPYGAAETLSRLEAQLAQRQLGVAARVNHAAAAQRVGQALRPTEVVIFGNPQAGTPLMQCSQTVGIDLPMKALVWVDAASQTWLGYNDPVWVVSRHGGGECPTAENVRKALAGIAEATVAR
ncbi:MAG: DUF302 domain-containing protein [Caldimonas sp.]